MWGQVSYHFELGKGVTLRDGTYVTLIATGLMVQECLRAAELLEKEGISARVINIHTLKPLDCELIIKAARETRALVTAEEHNIIGGLGSAVAETLAETCPTPLIRVGVRDEFGHSGDAGKLLELYGLTPENVAAQAKAVIARK